ncbi:hypothetical protein [Pseudothauera nasutitermitis]|uniref:hypothetical protein n=1 Tax=Pseudothauera nasutitermitis TaxID=2565930 RepID=UPI001454D00D|nr:hypothetical protein [Pseudothauera nasutitermitis]
MTVLSRQFIRRFDPLDTAGTDRLQKAASAKLEQWAENILDARTQGEVFGAQ